MKKAGICQICENNLGKYSCINCGRVVCENCYSSPICINCKRGIKNDTKRTENRCIC